MLNNYSLYSSHLIPSKRYKLDFGEFHTRIYQLSGLLNTVHIFICVFP